MSILAVASYQVMPPLSAEERAELKADIAERGVMVPVEYDEQGNILDGHHRVELCAELGLTNWPRRIRRGLSDAEKLTHARRLNLNRRHLDQAQRRALIEAELKQSAQMSDRKIAGGLGVDHKTVGSVRERLEATGTIGAFDRRVGKDERARRVLQTEGAPSSSAEASHNVSRYLINGKPIGGLAIGQLRAIEEALNVQLTIIASLKEHGQTYSELALIRDVVSATTLQRIITESEAGHR